MSANLWNSLEALPSLAAVRTEWEHELGNDFSASKAFLRPTQQQVESYPCTHSHPCGCRHRVVFDTPENISATCDCEEPACEPIFLRDTDLIVYELDGKMLASAIRQAFGFDEIQNRGFEEVRSHLVGRWGLRRTCVFFCAASGENSLLKEIDRLCAAISTPFLLLTPTSRFCTPMVQRALSRQGSIQIALADTVCLTAPGHLELKPGAKAAVEAMLTDFGRRITVGKPLELAIARVEEKLNALAKSRKQAREENDEVPEEVARQALALVQQLETGSRLKKPSILTVFRLYCINEMSATQIAKQCGCSKTAIVERLQILAQKTGMSAARLRRYSAHFERMEDEMTDWRAKKIDRHEVADGGPVDANDAS